MTPFLSTDAAVAGSLLAEAPPVISGPAAAGIVHALNLVPRETAWAADRNLRSGILRGFIDLPDDLAGGAR